MLDIIPYRGYGFILGLVLVLVQWRLSKRKPNFMSQIGIVSIGRMTLDAFNYAIFYVSGGSLLLGASMSDLSDSLLILVVWILHIGLKGWEQFKKPKKKPKRAKSI